MDWITNDIKTAIISTVIGIVIVDIYKVIKKFVAKKVTKFYRGFVRKSQDLRRQRLLATWAQRKPVSEIIAESLADLMTRQEMEAEIYRMVFRPITPMHLNIKKT